MNKLINQLFLLLLFFFFVQSEPVHRCNRPGESAGINIFRSVKMPWLLKYSFLATPKLFFISQTLASKPFIRRLDADYIGPKIENSTLARVTLFFPVVWHMHCRSKLTKCHWIQPDFRLQAKGAARVEQIFRAGM